MSLLLKWTKRNSTNVITEIYRSNTPLDKASLPAPLVTLSNQETQWLDATALQGQTYYYMWVTYNMQHTSPAYSPSTPITVAQRRGIGPNMLVAGNSDAGYYGDLTQSDVLSAAGLQALQNAGSTALTTPQTTFSWRKMLYKNKILLVPNRPVFKDSWQNVYKAGFVYGDVDRSKLPTVPTIDPSLAIAQNARVTIAGDQYIIRLMRGYSDDYTLRPTGIQNTVTTATTTTDTTPSPRYDNEYDALWLPNLTVTPVTQVLPNFPDAVTPANGTNYGTMVQELSGGATCLIRGGASDANSLGMTRQGLSLYATAGYGTTQAIVPILELVEV